MGELGRVGRVVATLGLGAALLLAGCGNDDGAGVRGGGSASASGSATGSGAGSGSGLAGQDLSGTTNDPQVQKAVADYKTWVVAEARRQFAPSRVRWERIEPIAGLVEEIDGKVDARVDDFEGEDDPAFTGWHRIEFILWNLGTTEGAAPFADQLDADLQTLDAELAGIEIPPAALAVGSSELIEEVSTGKITGEEDRYSGTDLWDFAANVEGSERAFELLTPALAEEDPELVADIESEFVELDAQLATYADGAGGYQPYSALTEADKTTMQTTLAELSENLATVAGVLGLE
jgi:iron uptake system component EfeO